MRLWSQWFGGTGQITKAYSTVGESERIPPDAKPDAKDEHEDERFLPGNEYSSWVVDIARLHLSDN